MGPKRFGKAGKLAFSFGNVAQDEGSAMAEYAWRKGWRTANLATNTYLVYFKNVVQAFDKRLHAARRQDRRPRDATRPARNNVNTAVSRLNGEQGRRDRHLDARSASCRRSSPGLRTLGNKTPILNSWAGDGTYWNTPNPKVTNYYAVTYASAFGDDPNKAVRTLAKQVKAGTGGFVTGAGSDRRHRHRDQALGRLDERRHAGGDDGEVQESADHLRARQLLAAVPHRVRTPVPRDPDRQQRCAVVGAVTAKVVPKI